MACERVPLDNEVEQRSEKTTFLCNLEETNKNPIKRTGFLSTDSLFQLKRDLTSPSNKDLSLY
jgi:hypothetical protein